MEENKKINSKKKAIITTVVSIIAVLVLGIGIGTASGYVINKNNKKITTTSKTELNTANENTEEGNQDDGNLVIQVDEEFSEGEDSEELTEEEKKQLEEQEKLKEAQKKEEEAKKQEEEKKKEESKNNTTTTKTTTSTSSGYPYYIKVNYTANTVTVYKKDDNGNYTVPVKAMICSTGAQTPHSGVYKTSDKYRWGTLIGPVWGQYCTRITGGILFHSVPYVKKNDPSSLEYWEYDRLGTTRSLGCVRLTVADAKWLYNNCPSGTSVEFYSSSNPGPLGKPGITTVSSAGDPYRGWDPTDPNPNNPWLTKLQQEAEEKKKAEEEEKESQVRQTIGFIGDINYCESMRQRYEGYVDALISEELRFDKKYILTESLPENYSHREIERMLHGIGGLPDAFVCANDDIAIKAARALKKRGFSVPEDIALTGFDNEEILTQTEPILTTVEVHNHLLGKRLVAQLLWRIMHPEFPRETVYIETKPIFRVSSMKKK